MLSAHEAGLLNGRDGAQDPLHDLLVPQRFHAGGTLRRRVLPAAWRAAELPRSCPHGQESFITLPPELKDVNVAGVDDESSRLGADVG